MSTRRLPRAERLDLAIVEIVEMLVEVEVGKGVRFGLRWPMEGPLEPGYM